MTGNTKKVLGPCKSFFWDRYWTKRKLDWREAFGCSKAALSHPHRLLIIEELQKFHLENLGEIGFGGGANLAVIKHFFPKAEVGGADISPEAVATVRRDLPFARADCASADDLFFADSSVQVVLTDMCLIYLPPRRIRRALREFKRIGRQRIILIEFHSTKWWRRLALWLASGYHAYDYRKLLEAEDFYDIAIKKVPEKSWPGGYPQKEFAFMITAKM